MLILIGQRVRSGTNFIGTTLSMHPDIVSIPSHETSGEFNLLKNRKIEEVFRDVSSKKSFNSGVHENDMDYLLSLYGKMWVDFLREKYKVPQDKKIFIKSPVVYNTDLWQKIFPNAKIILLCRDGRDNVISSVKASNDKRRWHTPLIKLKKKLNYSSGRFFINHIKDWKRTAQVYNGIKETKNLKKFKYEDLVNSKEGIYNLLKFCELNVSSEIVEKCLNAPVVGSSFGVSENKMSKPNWKPIYDKSKFKFTNKWEKWGRIKKATFNLLARKELNDLGYK